MDSEFVLSSKEPAECEAAELDDFVALVLAGGEVANQGLHALVRKSEQLFFLFHGECLAGVAAVKRPRHAYREKIFKQARAVREAESFTIELGWVFIQPSFRGKGLSHRLVEAATMHAAERKMYATSEVNNYAMHSALVAGGFVRHGERYQTKRGRCVALFIYEAIPPSRAGLGLANARRAQPKC